MSEIKKEPEKSGNSVLDQRLKRVEIIGKIERIRADKMLDELRIERQKLELEQVKRKEDGWNHPIDRLLDVARAWIIDNDKCLPGGEPALRSLWDEEDLDVLRYKILKKVNEL